MEAEIFRPSPDLGPVVGVHYAGVDRILKKYCVELLFDAIVHQLPGVPAQETEAIGVDSEWPPAGRRGCCPSGRDAESRTNQSGAKKTAASHPSPSILPDYVFFGLLGFFGRESRMRSGRCSSSSSSPTESCLGSATSASRSTIPKAKRTVAYAPSETRGSPFSILFKVIRPMEARSAKIATGIRRRRRASRMSWPSF